MEYASGGELFNRITTQGRIPESEAKSLFAQVVAGVAYMVCILTLVSLKRFKKI